LAHKRVDALDRRIIACLQVSGRQTNTEIAAQLGSSESTVRKRIDRMLHDDVIRITAVADPLKLDFPIVVIMGIQVTPSHLNSVAEQLNKLPEFRFIGLTTGAFDFVTEAWFSSLAELRQFLTGQLTAIEGLTRVETTQVLQMIRYAYDWGQPADGSIQRWTDARAVRRDADGGGI
jgi:Lrp/AsnC family transcriptional regulator, regulator for asnA, asnC and gidA